VHTLQVLKMRNSIIILLMVLMEWCVSGCMQPVNPQGRALLVTARQQYGKNDYLMCSNTLTKFLQDYGRTQEAGEAWYLRGLCHREMGTGKETEARADFEKALEKSRDAGIQALSHVALGHMSYEKVPPDLPGAINHYEKALKGLKDEPPKDVALYRLAVSLQRIGKWSDADRYLSRCFDTFPNSSFASYARNQFGSKMFRIQVAALSDLRNAQKKIQDLQGTGWKADWTAFQKPDGKMLYQVRVGQYPDYAQAQKALASLIKVEPQAEIVAASSVQK
jgi:tetratricopeptide (TPR) repeat protein